MNYGNVFAGDIEANGLYDEVTKLWCVVFQDVKTLEMYIYHDFPEYDGAVVLDPSDQKEYIIPKRNGSLVEGLREWYKIGQAGGKLAVHNCLSYDKPVIEKFYPKCKIPLETWHDTLIQSKIQWFDRPQPKGCRGTHGLAAYGIRFGVHKPEVKDWKEMDAFKLHRCCEDVKIQTQTYLYLEKERQVIKEKLGITFDQAFVLESEYRFNATNQEISGIAVDTEHMKKCVEELDNLIETIREEVEPQLPQQVKPKGVKITRAELGKALGVNIKDTYGIRSNGETVVDKPYYKPTTNYTKSKKYIKYYGIKGDKKTVSFPKKSECIKFIKDIYGSNWKSWDIVKDVGEEKELNVNTCTWFDITPDSDLVGGSFTKVEFSKTRLTQHAQVKDYLLSLGWKPTEWNYKKDSDGSFVRDDKKQLVKTTPKLTEDSYDSLPEGVGLKIAHYNTYQHRRRFLENQKDDEKGLINIVRHDGRISTGINAFNTSTGRSSHYGFVNAPGAGAIYGEEVRRSLVAPEGRVLVGADMKSAQLSIAAYYANNYDYYKAVADGQEIKTDSNGTELIHHLSGNPWYIGESGHCVNARMFTLVSEYEWRKAVESQDPDLIKHISLMRKKSKGGSFAVIFGASGKKVAQTLGIPEQLGEQKKQAFLQNIGLDESLKTLERMTNEYSRSGGGYIELPFGYYVWCNQKHKFFNYLDQGTEAVCQKVAVNYFEKEVKKRGLDCFKVLDYHKQLWPCVVTHIE